MAMWDERVRPENTSLLPLRDRADTRSAHAPCDLGSPSPGGRHEPHPFDSAPRGRAPVPLPAAARAPRRRDDRRVGADGGGRRPRNQRQRRAERDLCGHDQCGPRPPYRRRPRGERRGEHAWARAGQAAIPTRARWHTRSRAASSRSAERSKPRKRPARPARAFSCHAAARVWNGSSSAPSSRGGRRRRTATRARSGASSRWRSSWPSTPSVRASIRRASIACGGIVSRRMSCQWRERGSPKSISVCATSAR